MSIDRILSGQLPDPKLNLSIETLNESSINQEDEYINTRISRIFSYLKTVEDDTKSSIQETNSQNLVFDSLKIKMDSLKTQLVQKDEMISTMQLQIVSLKANVLGTQTQSMEDTKSKLTLQRKEYELIAKRQLTFIDKIIVEKQDLSEKYEELSRKSKSMEISHSDKTKFIEDAHKKEYRIQREFIQSQEKLKRDKWIAERTKEIKEDTVKSLEPEIQRMLAQHKIQTRQLEDRLAIQSNQEIQLLQDKHKQHLDTINNLQVLEQRKAINEEKESSKLFYTRQVERTEIDFQSHRRALNSNFQEERRELLDSFGIEKKKIKSENQDEIDRLKSSIQSNSTGSQNEIMILKEKHTCQLRQLEKSLKADFEKTIKSNSEVLHIEIRNREISLKQLMINERKKEIESLVIKLESENIIQTEGSIRKYSEELENQKKVHDKEIEKLRIQQKNTLEALSKAHQNTKELGLSAAKEKFRMDQLLSESSEKCNVIKSQRIEIENLSLSSSEIRENIRREQGEVIAVLNGSIQKLSNEKIDSDTLIRALKSDMQRIKRNANEEKEYQLKLIEGQVRKTVELKDDMITSLKLQLVELKEKFI